MTTDELRETYLDFFVSKGAERRPSDVLVPKGDATVLFTPAGMNQFKAEFMGLGDPKFKRATTCQKCIRTGDIDNVGKTGRHMTFFEMLGNFSFGDYFKREAINWAWEFLTEKLKISASKLTITVYLDDDEAFDIWNKEVGIPADRITRMGEDDNFWPASAPSQGPNGVCGPCSEIFYHYEDGREVEIWNLVFTQFNRVGPNQLEPLPSKNIDTGMGLERAAACLQEVPTVFETDIFVPLVAAVAETLGVNPAPGSIEETQVRRAADHARALTFTLHENVRPGPNQQGYVVRRLLRRAVLDAYLMGHREPYLVEIIPVVADVMKQPYPDLAESIKRIQHTVREEESQFLRKIESGLKLFDETVEETKLAGTTVISGESAFRLHSTHGFPIEMTSNLAAERSLTVNMEEYQAAVDRHAETSGQDPAAAVFSTGPLDALKQDYPQGTEFLGYETTEADASIIGIVANDLLVERADTAGSNPIALVLDRSPFYGESGGQIGDTGVIEGNGFRFQVEDTQRNLGFVVHVGQVVEGEVTRLGSVTAMVDKGRREGIRRAHSATHILHHALHLHLGKHAQQAGSKVEPDRLRFDFSNPDAVGRDRLRLVEETVSERILDGDAIQWRSMPIEEARSLGAMALFGEKYPSVVRVVEMGEFSKELCGGTHLDNIALIGPFKIVGEESVSAGVRRITAVTGKAALEFIRQEEDALGEIATALKIPIQQAAQQSPARIAALLEEIKTLKKQSIQRREAPKVSVDELLGQVAEVKGIKILTAAVPDSGADDIRQLIDVARRKVGAGLAALLITSNDGKVILAAGLTPDLVDRGLHAGNWMKEVAPVVGGGGGGKPDFAQAGGKKPDQIPAALEKARAVATAALES